MNTCAFRLAPLSQPRQFPRYVPRVQALDLYSLLKSHGQMPPANHQVHIPLTLEESKTWPVTLFFASFSLEVSRFLCLLSRPSTTDPTSLSDYSPLSSWTHTQLLEAGLLTVPLCTPILACVLNPSIHPPGLITSALLPTHLTIAYL